MQIQFDTVFFLNLTGRHLKIVLLNFLRSILRSRLSTYHIFYFEQMMMFFFCFFLKGYEKQPHLLLWKGKARPLRVKVCHLWPATPGLQILRLTLIIHQKLNFKTPSMEKQKNLKAGVQEDKCKLESTRFKIITWLFDYICNFQSFDVWFVSTDRYREHPHIHKPQIKCNSRQ